MSQRPALLLDVLDTLVLNPFFQGIEGFFGLGWDEFLAAKDHDAWLAFERGEITEAALGRHYFLDRRSVDMAALRAWYLERYGFIEGIEAVLADLRDAGVRCYALSNYPAWYRLIEDRLHLSRFLDWRFVSCLTGVRKPDSAAYRGAAQALAVGPEACVFVDDSARNVASAQAEGMTALLFTDAPTLRAQLEALGLLPGRARG